MLINMPGQKKELYDYYGENLNDNSLDIVGKCSFDMLKEVIFQWIQRTHHRG